MSKMKAALSAHLRKLLDLGLDENDIIVVTGYPADVVRSALAQEPAK